MDADQLARGLRDEAAAAVARPDLAAARRGVDRRVRRSRLRRGAAAVAVVLAVLVAGAVVLSQRGSQSAQRVVTRPEAVPHLAPTYVPPQVTFSHLIELPSSSSLYPNIPESHVWIYATGAPGNPVGGSSFAILSSAPPAGNPSVTGGMHAVNLGDQKGWAVAESTGGSVFVLSRDLAATRTEAIARDVRQDPHTWAPTQIPVPAGYHLAVAGVPSGYLGGAEMALDSDAHGYALTYQASDPGEVGDRVMIVGVTSAGPADLLALRWELDHAKAVEVDGHAGIVGTQPGGSSSSATASGQGSTVTPGPPIYVEGWLQDGALVTVEILNLDGHCPADCNSAVVQRVAASVAPVPARQWQAMLDASATTTTLPAGCVRENNGEVCATSGTGIEIAPPSSAEPTTGPGATATVTDPGTSVGGPTTSR